MCYVQGLKEPREGPVQTWEGDERRMWAEFRSRPSQRGQRVFEEAGVDSMSKGVGNK